MNGYPAFGGAVAASRRLFYGTPEGVPFRLGVCYGLMLRLLRKGGSRFARWLIPATRLHEWAPILRQAVAASRRLFYGTPEGVPFRL
jgi:hypothetical protein